MPYRRSRLKPVSKSARANQILGLALDSTVEEPVEAADGERMSRTDPISTTASPLINAGREPASLGLKSGDLVERIVEFIEALPVTSGLLAGERMTVFPWQREIIEGLYGNERRVRTGVVSVARKNGKSAFMAALALATLLGPLAEQGGQIILAATDVNQAGNLFGYIVSYIDAVPKYVAMTERTRQNEQAALSIRRFARSIDYRPNGSTLKVVSSDGKRQHGLNASLVIADEVAQWPKRELYDVLRTSTGARANPLMLTISTQSADPNSLMSELVDYAVSVEGRADDRSYGYVRTADDDLEFDDPVAWEQANPGLDAIRSRDELEVSAREARHIPQRQAAFRNLYLNQRIEADATFLPVSEWLACEGVPERRGPCYIGLDLASVNDLAAIAVYWPATGAVDAWHWGGSKSMDQLGRLPLYEWEQDGLLHVGEGTIQKSDVARKLGELVETYEVEAVVYDRWAIAEFTQAADREGIVLPEMFPFGQGFRDMSPAIDEFERLVLEREIVHSNPMLTWQFGNIVIETDAAENRKFVKSKAIDKIDGVLALVMAVGRAAKSREYEYNFSEAVIRV